MLDTARAQHFGRIGGTCDAHRAAMRVKVASCRAKYAACADAGMTRDEAARHLRLSRSAVDHAAWRYGIRFAGDRK